MNALSAFPKRPLQVSLGLKQAAALVIAGLTVALTTGGLAYLALSLGGSLIREAGVWRTGQQVPIQAMDGQCRTRISFLPLSDCRLNITYEAPGGASRMQEMRALVIGGLTEQGEPSLKADPADPSRIALSWLVEAMTERWFVLAGLFFVVLAMTLSILGGLLKSLSEWRLYRSMGRQPRPVAATILNIRLISSPSWAREYEFSYEADGAVRKGRQKMRVLKGQHGVSPDQWQYEKPIMLKDGKSHEVLALLGPKNKALLVPESFAPLVLTDDEKQAVLSAPR